MKRHLISVLLILMVLSTTSCAPLLYTDPTHWGKVVDAETGEPIEGAVAVGVWLKVYPTVAGASTAFYDSYETTTDKNGRFTIPGKGFRLLSIMDGMYLSLVKVGYGYIDDELWSDLKKNPGIEHDGQMLIFKLRKRSIDQRRRGHIPLSASLVPQDLTPLLFQEALKERKEIGLDRRVTGQPPKPPIRQEPIILQVPTRPIKEQ